MPGAPDAGGPSGADAGTGGGGGPPLQNVVSISVSFGFGCAALADGSVVCWGFNDQGILGNRETIALVPTPIVGLVGATGVATGSEHACALVAGGEAWCWGRGAAGALGDGESGSFHRRSTPMAAIGLRGARTISAGENRACVLVAGGSVYCWGINAGDGSNGGPTVPMPVPGLSGVAVVGCGQRYTCVALANGSVQCWGDNYGGQLGRGLISQPEVDTGAAEYVPGPVTGLADARYVAAGSSHTCAIVGQNGGVRCWGANGNGQLGDGTTTASASPVAVSGVTGAKAVAVGGLHTCALLEDGSVRCWGSNSSGQLGNGQSRLALPSSAAPVRVEITDVTAIATRGQHTCAVLSDRTARCWGYNQLGQLGSGATSEYEALPIAVKGGNQVR